MANLQVVFKRAQDMQANIGFKSAVGFLRNQGVSPEAAVEVLLRMKRVHNPVPRVQCKCDAYRFPHRMGSGRCGEDPWLAYREPAGITMPGRSNFDSDADYWAAATRRQ